MSDTPQPDNRTFEELEAPEKRAAVIWQLAVKASEAPDRIRSIESAGKEAKAKFIDFARDYFELFQALAEDSRTNQNTAQIGNTFASITKTRKGEPEAVGVFIESFGNETRFQLPNPDLLETGNNEWSPDSMPIGSSSILFDGMEEPLEFRFNLMHNPGVGMYTNFATSIAFAAEVLVAANAPETLDLTDD